MGTHRLILASQSPRRRELLALLGLPFETTTPDVDEAPRTHEPPADLAVRLSQAKALAADGRPGDLIIACDTIVAHQDDILGKPRDEAEAAVMLARLRGQFHTVFSSVTLLETVTGRTVTDLAGTQVLMRDYTHAEVATYVATRDPLDKAGAYAIQHTAFRPVSKLQGCYASVMGLPLCHLVRCFRAWDIEPPGDVPAACQAHNRYLCSVYSRVLAGQPGSSPL